LRFSYYLLHSLQISRLFPFHEVPGSQLTHQRHCENCKSLVWLDSLNLLFALSLLSILIHHFWLFFLGSFGFRYFQSGNLVMISWFSVIYLVMSGRLAIFFHGVFIYIRLFCKKLRFDVRINKIFELKRTCGLSSEITTLNMIQSFIFCLLLSFSIILYQNVSFWRFSL
jgi:hypothetical protein